MKVFKFRKLAKLHHYSNLMYSKMAKAKFFQALIYLLKSMEKSCSKISMGIGKKTSLLHL